MTKVAPIPVQSSGRPMTARRAVPVSEARPVVQAALQTLGAHALPPQASPMAAAVLGALIEIQAKAARVDPQPPVARPPVSGDRGPDHGDDDQHGHAPADPPVLTPPVVPPPVAQPPAPQPRVAVDPNPDHGRDDQHGHKPPVAEPPPPVVQPPVVQPPLTPPRPVIADAGVGRRSLAILNQTLIERDAIRRDTAAFSAQAAERHAAASMMEDGSAVALLQVLEAGMTAFDNSFRASRLRRGFYA